MSIVIRFVLTIIICTVLLSCRNEQTGFQLLLPEDTGITFSNDLEVSDTFNAVYYEYIYNGGGVAAGDVNGDGLTDLFFSGNQVSSRLYLNRGDFSFEDVTEAAAVTTDRWCTGVAMADVNDDGKLDIYVSVAGYQQPSRRMANLLFINQGNNKDGVPEFQEMAGIYGVADTGYSTQAAFLDYDLDGDLDLYLLTNALEKFNRNQIRPKRIAGEAASTDRLYRNDGPVVGEWERGRVGEGEKGKGKPLSPSQFVDVSAEAGILIEGYGLGVAVSDINQDGYPDIYCANDFLSNDLLWINNGNGTFTNKAAEYLKHQTHNGMGADVADLNNDGLPEIAVLDMLPEGNARQKIMLPNDNYDKYRMRSALGYQPQFMRNTLQYHQGYTPDGEPRFSEIGWLSGLAATDWSWSVLFADLDNDGRKDAYISNGYRKDITNLDFINYSDMQIMFGTPESKRKRAFDRIEALPEVKVHNYLYRNDGHFRFTNVAAEWGLDQPSFSNGAVYADLDNDGDLDLALNNIDAPAFIYRNQRRQEERDKAHYLRILLKEDQPDMQVFNTKVMVYTGGNAQYQDYTRYRGYKSTMEAALHFGLGEATTVDSVVIVWPDGAVNRWSEPAVDQLLELTYQETEEHNPRYFHRNTAKPLFQKAGVNYGIQHRDTADEYVDFKTTRTLPHLHSKEGFGMAVGDVNGDGREDFYIGSDAQQPGIFFIQGSQGRFRRQPLGPDSAHQDMGSLLFDADQDGDLDLYVVSGGSRRPTGDTLYQDRFYRNDGNARFRRDRAALPALTSSGSCVAAADYDRDGDLDLFVGGRIVPSAYPLSAESYILENKHIADAAASGFEKVTQKVAPELAQVGLVTAALWTDYDNDGWTDLIVAGEWMPVTFFHNEKGRLVKVDLPVVDSDDSLLSTGGWWNSIAGADFDGDGDVDYVLGNLGLNSKLKASQQEPLQIYAADFDGNGAIDPLLALYNQGRQYPLHSRDMLVDQIAGMKRRFSSYDQYAQATFDQVLTKEEAQKAEVRSAYLLSSVILENRGAEGFRLHPLPVECQMAPISGLLVEDINGDGLTDIMATGNFYYTETTLIGRYDASYGHVLINRGSMDFDHYNGLRSGFYVPGDGRSLTAVNLSNGRKLYLAAQREDSLLVFQTAKPLESSVFRAAPLDARVEVVVNSGDRIVKEFYYGQGYLSQSARTWRLPDDAKEIIVTTYAGERRSLQAGDLLSGR